MTDPRRVETPTEWAPYMHWSKTHERALHDLTGSNLLPLGIEELPGGIEAVRLTGPNDEGYTPLVESIAARYGVEADRVCTAPGTSGANFLAMAALIRPGDEVLVERPTYDPLPGAARLLGAEIRRFDRAFEDGFQPDPERVAGAVTARTRLVVLTNLHNPSGVLIPEATIREIGVVAESVGARVLVDEVYLETAFDVSPRPAATVSDTFISSNSLTKTFGLAGLRCGWAIASPTVAEAMRRARDVVDAVGSFPSETLATVAFAQIDRLLDRAREILVPNLRRLGETVEGAPDLAWATPEGGPGGFPCLLGTEDAEPFVEFLEREFETSVAPGRFFEAPAHFRVAIGGAVDRVSLGLDALDQALAAWAARVSGD
jgi:aspartate/methionine/tyrosine aminotransferase